MNINEIPIYRAFVNMDDEETGMVAISLVDEPAIDIDFLAFDKDEKPLMFSKDELQHKITGPAIIADKYIYRYSETIGEYYTYFDKETIEQIVEKYSKQNLFNSVDLQHDGKQVSGITLIEMFIKDSTKGISPKGFDEVSDGSLFVTFKVDNDEVWDEIINGDTLKGFSIEIFSDFELIEMSKKKEPTFDEWVDSFLPDQDEKKKFDKNTPVTVEIANRAIKNKRQVVIDGKQGQVLAVAKENNKPNIIFQDNNGKWNKIYLDDIKKWTLTDEALIDWNWDDPEYQKLIDDEDNIIEETSVATATTLEDAINGNYVTIINYNDESDSPATGARQCWVSSLGYTTAGNGCVRIFEQYGASKSGIQANEGWRLLLVRRITSFRILTDVEPYFEAPSKLYNGEAQAGSGKNGTMSSVRAKSRLI